MQISMWKEKSNIEMDYVKQTNTVYIRTKIGCWKIVYDKKYKAVCFITETLTVKSYPWNRKWMEHIIINMM